MVKINPEEVLCEALQVIARMRQEVLTSLESPSSLDRAYGPPSPISPQELEA